MVTGHGHGGWWEVGRLLWKSESGNRSHERSPNFLVPLGERYSGAQRQRAAMSHSPTFDFDLSITPPRVREVHAAADSNAGVTPSPEAFSCPIFQKKICPLPMTKMMIAMLRPVLLLLATIVVLATAKDVVVETKSLGSGPPVTKDNRYKAMVTLYIEGANRLRMPTGWTTREEDGADADSTFEFQPGVDVIQGWTEGVLQMNVGDRALIHVPSEKGYGAKLMDRDDLYIPANSDLLVDIEILGTVAVEEPDL